MHRSHRETHDGGSDGSNHTGSREETEANVHIGVDAELLKSSEEEVATVDSSFLNVGQQFNKRHSVQMRASCIVRATVQHEESGHDSLSGTCQCSPRSQLQGTPALRKASRAVSIRKTGTTDRRADIRTKYLDAGRHTRLIEHLAAIFLLRLMTRLSKTRQLSRNPCLGLDSHNV